MIRTEVTESKDSKQQRTYPYIAERTFKNGEGKVVGKVYVLMREPKIGTVLMDTRPAGFTVGYNHIDVPEEYYEPTKDSITLSNDFK